MPSTKTLQKSQDLRINIHKLLTKTPGMTYPDLVLETTATLSCARKATRWLESERYVYSEKGRDERGRVTLEWFAKNPYNPKPVVGYDEILATKLTNSLLKGNDHVTAIMVDTKLSQTHIGNGLKQMIKAKIIEIYKEKAGRRFYKFVGKKRIKKQKPLLQRAWV